MVKNYYQLPIFETVLSGIKIVGSIVGTPFDLAEVDQLHAAGRTKVMYETRHLEQVNAAMEEVEQARISARLVFDITWTNSRLRWSYNRRVTPAMAGVASEDCHCMQKYHAQQPSILMPEITLPKPARRCERASVKHPRMHPEAREGLPGSTSG